MSGTAQEAGAEASRSDVGFGFRCFEGRVYVDSLLTTAHKTPSVPTCTPNPTKPQALKPTTPDWAYVAVGFLDLRPTLQKRGLKDNSVNEGSILHPSASFALITLLP